MMLQTAARRPCVLLLRSWSSRRVLRKSGGYSYIIPTHLHDFAGTQQFLGHRHELECGQRYGEMSLVANATLDPLLDLLLRIVDDKKHSDGHVQMDSKIDNGSAAVETLDQAVYGPADSDEATKSAGDPDQSVTDPEILRLHASKRVVDLFTFLILGHQHSPCFSSTNRIALCSWFSLWDHGSGQIKCCLPTF